MIDNLRSHRIGIAILGSGLVIVLSLTNVHSQSASRDKAIQVLSPDGSIEIQVATKGVLTYSVRIDSRSILTDSKLGLEFRDGIKLGSDVELVALKRGHSNNVWQNRWGKRSQVRDQYNEARLLLREHSGAALNFEVIFRAYNDGIGFRYILPNQPRFTSFVLQHEATEFSFAGDYPCFAGQQEKGFRGAQEWEFKPLHLSDIKSESLIGLPLLVQTPAAWLALGEADLRDWAGMWLGQSSNSTSSHCVSLMTKLAPRLDGEGLVKAAAPHSSPWRMLLIGRDPGRLIESDLVLNLSTPCQLADTSCVQPGKMAWDHWWSGDVQMDTSTIKEYIQLAAEMGWPYQLIDWQWYGPFNQNDSDITKVNPAVDMEEVQKVAKQKGVRLWLWLYHADVDRNDAYKKAFALYEKWGIAGIKIDFMDRDDQEMVNWYEKITAAAAEHHLMVNFHGAFKTSGFNRTFPNQITREGVLGNEYNRWSTRVTPEHKLTLPFTRFLAGPADFTPGGFLNRQPAQFKANSKAAEVQGTRAAELALFVAYDSPLCCVCDHPSHYEGQPGAGFLKIVPTVWDDTRVLQAEVGRHLLLARRSNQDWFVAGLTAGQERTDSLNLDFLKKGGWRMRLWKDASDSDTNAEHLDTEERVVTAAETVSVKLAPSGGFVAWLKRER